MHEGAPGKPSLGWQRQSFGFYLRSYCKIIGEGCVPEAGTLSSVPDLSLVQGSVKGQKAHSLGLWASRICHTFFIVFYFFNKIQCLLFLFLKYKKHLSLKTTPRLTWAGSVLTSGQSESFILWMRKRCCSMGFLACRCLRELSGGASPGPCLLFLVLCTPSFLKPISCTLFWILKIIRFFVASL